MSVSDLKGVFSFIVENSARSIALQSSKTVSELYPKNPKLLTIGDTKIQLDQSPITNYMLVYYYMTNFIVNCSDKVIFNQNIGNRYSITKEIIEPYIKEFYGQSKCTLAQSDYNQLIDAIVARAGDSIVTLYINKQMDQTHELGDIRAQRLYFKSAKGAIKNIMSIADGVLTPKVVKTIFRTILLSDNEQYMRYNLIVEVTNSTINQLSRSILWRYGWAGIAGIIGIVLVFNNLIAPAIPIFLLGWVITLFGDIEWRWFSKYTTWRRYEPLFNHILDRLCTDEINMILQHINKI